MAGRLNTTNVRVEFSFPPPPPPKPAGPEKIQAVASGGTVRFTVNGVTRWSIDVALFAGTPQLSVTQIPGNLPTRVTLTGAKLPGTDLPADFVLDLEHTGPGVTAAHFTFTLGGFDARVPFEEWLTGRAELSAAAQPSGRICPLGTGSQLSFASAGAAGFTPDWRMRFDGPGIATLTGPGGPLRADGLTLQLLQPTDASLGSTPEPKRTGITVAAGTHSWTLAPAVRTLDIGALKAAPGTFSALQIETGETGSGSVARRLLATGGTGLSLALRGGFTDENGAPFGLVLAAPAYAIAFETAVDNDPGDQTCLNTRLAAPSWLVVDGFALLLCDPVGTPGFTCATADSAVTELRCEPWLSAAAAPLDAGSGLSAAPKFLKGPPLPIVAEPGAEPGWGLLAGPATPGRRRFSLPDFAVSVLRRDDLLALDFRCYNLALEGGGGIPPQLVRKDSARPAHLTATFDAPQNIAEQAFLETYDPPAAKNHQPPPADPQSLAGETPPLPGRVGTRAAGPSRLAFRLPSGTAALPYSLTGLLNWVALEQSVAPVAAAPDPRQDGAGRILPQPQPAPAPPPIVEPGEDETSIEAPWRLNLSPNYSGAWAHSIDAVTLDGRTELWHTRLAVRTTENNAVTADETLAPRVRAVWSPDYTPGEVPDHAGPPFNDQDPAAPFRMSLDPNDRDQIVRLSSDFTMRTSTGAGYQPSSIRADKLYLSTLGAWLEVFGDWIEPLPLAAGEKLSLLQWQHRATLGRDNYVRVVYAGYLLPFGHAASLVKVTERKLLAAGGGPTTAYLRQRFFVVVRQPTVTYTSPPLSHRQLRELPYSSVTITTLVTPDVVPELVAGKYAFFPLSAGNPYPFHLVGTDRSGGASEFSAPLYFVESGGNYKSAITAYNTADMATVDLYGQQVAFAKPQLAGDTTLQTRTMTFRAEPAQPSQTADAPFHAAMAGADVVVEAIGQLTGGAGAMSISYPTGYLTNGLGVGEVFAQNAGPAIAMQFNGKQAGGVAVPNINVTGLSRKFGTVSGALDKLDAGDFDPAEIFGGAAAKLFGCIDLKDLLTAAIGGAGQVPKMLTERLPDRTSTTMEFAPAVPAEFTALGGILVLKFDKPAEALSLRASIVTPLKGGEPTVDIHGELNKLTLSLANVIGITIDQISFDAVAGKKMSFSVEMPSADSPINFLGDLEFLNELRKYIPADGFTDPPSLDVSPQGITAGYSLPIPTIGVGVFSLENIRLSAALTLPFLPPDPLRFRFNFAERQHPFNITVSLLGGGGFFGIAVGPDGVEMIEAAIEVGANASINVVVASGNVHMMAGVYLKYNDTDKKSELTGYVRAGGSLSVLGLVTVTVEFYLGFTYFGGGGQCKIAGEATISIEIDLTLFSKTVHATLRREFEDPTITFAELIGPADWNDYCDAFAA